MNTLRLTEKVSVLSYGSQDDGYGGTIPSVTVDFEMWAQIEQLRTGKDIEQAQITLPATYRMRSRKEVTAKSGIRWRGQDYSVISTPWVDHVRRTRYYVCDMHRMNK